MVLRNVKSALQKKQNTAVTDIKDKAKLFLDDRKHANNLIDIIAASESEDSSVILATIRAFHRIFIHLIKHEEMYIADPQKDDEQSEKECSPDETYRMWLRGCYSEAVDKLLELLRDEHENVSELSLCTLMKFVEAEGQMPLTKCSKKHLKFPSKLYVKVYGALLSDEYNMVSLIERMQEFLEYDDVRYFTMKYALTDIKEKTEQQICSDVYLKNMFSLLDHLSMPSAVEELLSNFLAEAPGPEVTTKMNSFKTQQKQYTTLWLEFLKNKLSISLYKKVLISLHEKVMPHMSNPLLLSDFLTESYNVGGAVSLLALNGLFILIQKYNLNYPDFFIKLYALLEPSVFQAKFRARFFFLTDLFLTSTHVPSYLVAAFAKKLSRLSLVAPPDVLTFLIPLVLNLLIRHPNCKVLIHRAEKEGQQDVITDPFLMDEKDPSKCHAYESSLWEIKSLQGHYFADVIQSAKRVGHNLPEREFDISEKLNTTMDELFDAESKKTPGKVPVTFHPPKGLFGNEGDKFSDIWLLE